MLICGVNLGGLWQSQVGERLLCEWTPDGKRGDVNVYKYFVFLAITLIVVGTIGAFLLEVVNEEGLINDAAEELERSGLLEDSEFFTRGGGVPPHTRYGTVVDIYEEDGEEEEEARKKTWLLNAETRRFLKDHTMWWLAAGFFFVSGWFKLLYCLIALKN